MSAKELIFKYSTNELIVKELESKDIALAINGRAVYLDRSQAHLLMLYLQEKLWYCPRCDKYHAADYTCERI